MTESSCEGHHTGGDLSRYHGSAGHDHSPHYYAEAGETQIHAENHISSWAAASHDGRCVFDLHGSCGVFTVSSEMFDGCVKTGAGA